MTGLSTMIRLVLRRNRVRLVVWLVVLVGMYQYIVSYYKQTFTTQASLDEFAALSASPGMRAITGLSPAANTMGGAVWTKGWMTVALALAIGMVFLVTRSGRADEETGRTELLRSKALGVHAYSAAAWLVYGTLSLLVGAGLTAVSWAGGFGASGSLVLGGATFGAGLVGLGVGALAGQLAATSRGANSLGSAVIVVFYMLRMSGDMGDGTLTWASPIGWAQQMQPYAANRWWPFALLVLLAAALLGVAWVLEARRDFGAGLLPQRHGASHAPARWATPLGLELHLQRNPIMGWTLAVALSGLMFGSVVTAMTDLLDDTNVAALLRGEGVKALVSLLVSMMALLTLVFAIQITVSLRKDEAKGLVDAQITRAVSRARWALERLLIPAVWSAVLLPLGGAVIAASYDRSQVGRLALAALAYWPAVMVLVGLSVFLWGFAPRLSTPTAWGLMAAMWFLTMFGEVFRLPEWFLNAMPLAATPYMPFEEMSWTPLVVMTAIACALTAAGVWRFTTRDIQTN